MVIYNNIYGVLEAFNNCYNKKKLMLVGELDRTLDSFHVFILELSHFKININLMLQWRFVLFHEWLQVNKNSSFHFMFIHKLATIMTKPPQHP